MTNPVVATQDNNAVALPQHWAEKLGAYAKSTQQVEKPSGQFFSTKSGVLSFAQQPLKDNTVDVIVLHSMHENVLYPTKFNPDAISSPVCYAFSLDGTGMAPHEDAADPKHPACTDCPNNAWNSGEGGRGKACKNMRRLALMPVSALASPEEVQRSTCGYMRVPVTSVKYWSAHAQYLAAQGMPPFAAVTRIKLMPDPKTMQRLSFDVLRIITDEALLTALERRHLSEAQLIGFPYPKPEAEDGGYPANSAAVAAAKAPAKTKKF